MFATYFYGQLIPFGILMFIFLKINILQFINFHNLIFKSTIGTHIVYYWIEKVSIFNRFILISY